MNIFLALLFSLTAPGAGQIYNGDYALGACFGGFFVLWHSLFAPLILRIAGLSDPRRILRFAAIVGKVFICIIIISMAEAGFSAIRNTNPFSWGSVGISLASAVILVAAQKALLRSPFPDMVAGLAGFMDLIRPDTRTRSGD
ncbi:MAG: hypothetical protein WCS77_05735 [Elusimicrobiaceae bacterium]|jgi:hypothetical protein